jgi:hypothetical protein
MSKRLSQQSNRFGFSRSVGVLVCILGILAGIFFMFVGGKILGSAIPNDADFRAPLGALIGLGGMLIFLVPTIGLASLIGSRFAKSTIARFLLNVIGAAAALVIVGAGLSVLISYLHIQGIAERRAVARAKILEQAELGDASAQIYIARRLYPDWQYSYMESLRSPEQDPVFCPDVLYWYRQAAFQGEDRGIEGVSTAYIDCAPGDHESNLILAQVWRSINYESAGSENWSADIKDSLSHFQLEPDALAAAQITAEKLAIRLREILAEPDMSVADRQLAMDSAVRELMPLMNGDIDD